MYCGSTLSFLFTLLSGNWGEEKQFLMKYNGLKADMSTFAKLIYIYETQIKYFNKESEFEYQYKKAHIAYKNLIKKKIKYATREDIKSLEPEIEVPPKLYFTKRTVLVLDLLRHLRNSFSHGLLTMESNKIIVCDKYRNFQTSKGYLEYKLLKEFIVEIVKEYEG